MLSCYSYGTGENREMLFSNDFRYEFGQTGLQAELVFTKGAKAALTKEPNRPRVGAEKRYQYSTEGQKFHQNLV